VSRDFPFPCDDTTDPHQPHYYSRWFEQPPGPTNCDLSGVWEAERWTEWCPGLTSPATWAETDRHVQAGYGHPGVFPPNSGNPFTDKAHAINAELRATT